MRMPPLIGTVIALGLLAATLPISATEQDRDMLTFAGQQHPALERPLNDFLGRLRTIPRFDIPNTANYKGYRAAWEVRDSKLYLASFSAATNGQPFSVAFLFPGRRLPFFADWYSGTVHVVRGRETLAQGYYTYERITALRITNGVVTTTNEMRNIREDKLNK